MCSRRNRSLVLASLLSVSTLTACSPHSASLPLPFAQTQSLPHTASPCAHSLYVSDSKRNEVLVYPPQSITPNRVIKTPIAGQSPTPWAIAVDRSCNLF